MNQIQDREVSPNPESERGSKTLEQWYRHFARQNNHVDIAKWPNPRTWEGASWTLIVGWMWADTCRFLSRCREVYSEVRAFGGVISREYGVPRWRQVAQLCYLAFGLGIPLKHYRGYQLFKPERWKRVDAFLYEQGTLQRECIARSFPDEKNVLRDKLEFYRYCRSHDIPTPEVLAAFEDGRVIFPEDGMPQFPEKDLLVKDLRGGQGEGIEKYAFDEEGTWKREQPSRGPEALMEHFAQRSAEENGIIVQPVVHNHDDWQPFTSGALATVRIVTARSNEGEITPIGAALRMPTGDAVVDNFSAGGIASPIDVSTGRLGPAVTSVPREGRFEMDRHPDTGDLLAGSVLPEWGCLVDVVMGVHSCFQSIFVGWDVAYTGHGFRVIEGNLHWSSRLMEAPSTTPLSETSYPQLYEMWMREIIDTDSL